MPLTKVEHLLSVLPLTTNVRQSTVDFPSTNTSACLNVSEEEKKCLKRPILPLSFPPDRPVLFNEILWEKVGTLLTYRPIL